jgi:hypothetical protein
VPILSPILDAKNLETAIETGADEKLDKLIAIGGLLGAIKWG